MFGYPAAATVLTYFVSPDSVGLTSVTISTTIRKRRSDATCTHGRRTPLPYDETHHCMLFPISISIFIAYCTPKILYSNSPCRPVHLIVFPSFLLFILTIVQAVHNRASSSLCLVDAATNPCDKLPPPFPLPVCPGTGTVASRPFQHRKSATLADEKQVFLRV